MKNRFIDTEYNTLFTLEDGEKVRINYSDGRPSVEAVVVGDGETHFTVGGYLYHICEFAERMQRIGATYEPAEPAL